MRSDDPPTLDDILELRRNKNGAYEKFCAFILPGAVTVKSKSWEGETGYNAVSKLANSVEEAFALLELKNNWEVWTEIAVWLDENVGKKLEDMEGTASKPIYTHRDKDRDSGKVMVEGWLPEGHQWFKDWHDKVVADRSSQVGKAFEEVFKTKQYERMEASSASGTKQSGKKRKAVAQPCPSRGVDLLAGLLDEDIGAAMESPLEL